MLPEPVECEPLRLVCDDGFALAGHVWRPPAGSPASRVNGTVLIAPATGVLARYYGRYARFLAENGYNVVTFDYRGIGLSRPPSLRGMRVRWADWGRLDLETALRHAALQPRPLHVVGHSIGGVLIGYAASACAIDRVLTVGAQYAYWRDYATARRRRLLLRWHAAMPVLALVCGYFPGRRLGWLEDLPRGVALDWSTRRARLEASHPLAERADVLRAFAKVRAPILAVTASDDDYATLRAVGRALAYFSGAERRVAMLRPAMLGVPAIGHFALFHSSYRDTFWQATLGWLGKGAFAGSQPFDPRRPHRDDAAPARER